MQFDLQVNPAAEPAAQGISRDQVAQVDFIFHVASDHTSGVRDQWELLIMAG